MSKAEEHIDEYYLGTLSYLEGIHKELVLKAMQSFADEQNKELISRFEKALKNVSEYIPEEIAFQIIYSLNQKQ